MRKAIQHVQTCAVHPPGSICPSDCIHQLRPSPEAVAADAERAERLSGDVAPNPTREEARGQLLASGMSEAMADQVLDAPGSPYYGSSAAAYTSGGG